MRSVLAGVALCLCACVAAGDASSGGAAHVDDPRVGGDGAADTERDDGPTLSDTPQNDGDVLVPGEEPPDASSEPAADAGVPEDADAGVPEDADASAPEDADADAGTTGDVSDDDHDEDPDGPGGDTVEPDPGASDPDDGSDIPDAELDGGAADVAAEAAEDLGAPEADAAFDPTTDAEDVPVYSDVPVMEFDLPPPPGAALCRPAQSPVPSPAPREVLFVDRSDALAGAGVQWVPGATLEASLCGEGAMLGSGAAIDDFDDDGDLDIFYPRYNQAPHLYRNDGGWVFTDIAGAVGLDGPTTGNGPAWVDIDADGDLDLYVATLGGDPNRLYLQEPDGSFLDRAFARGLAMSSDRERDCGWMFGATFGDADGDGDLDLFQSRWIPRGTVWGSRYLENQGTGVFEDRTLSAGLLPRSRSVVFGSTLSDFDGDHDGDLLLTADFGTSRYYRREPGYFYPFTDEAGLGAEENGMGTAAGDIDGDGDLDIVITSIYGESETECALSWGCTGNRVYVNDGAGRFADCTSAIGARDSGWGWGVALWDYDNDGDLDVGSTSGYRIPWDDPRFSELIRAITRYDRGGARLWRNDRTLPFVEVSVSVGASVEGLGRAYIPFDADRDGDLDLFVVRSESTPALLENTGGEARAWLAVRLRMPAGPNTRALGASVTVEPRPGDAGIRRDLTPGGAFLTALPAEVHFGLGDHLGPIHRVRVRWPDGAESALSDVAPSQLLTVTR